MRALRRVELIWTGVVLALLAPAQLGAEGLGEQVARKLREVATLVAADAETADWFGYSVAVSGDTIVVGAYGDDFGETNNQGSVYVFTRPPEGWSGALEVARLTASDAFKQDQFGRSVAMSGDTIVVGASLDDVIQGDEGSAYVFVEPPGGWAHATENAKLTASDGEVNDNLGVSVAVSGGTVVAGARNDDVDGATSRGSAYVFVEPRGGWADGVETAKLTAADGDFGDELGTAVAVAGHTIVAGAPDHDIGSGPQGAAFVFFEPPQGWATGTESQKLVAAGSVAGDALGSSVDVDANTVAAASLYDDVEVPNQGSVTVFAGRRLRSARD